jgi:hypothetical protein
MHEFRSYRNYSTKYVGCECKSGVYRGEFWGSVGGPPPDGGGGVGAGAEAVGGGE